MTSVEQYSVNMMMSILHPIIKSSVTHPLIDFEVMSSCNTRCLRSASGFQRRIEEQISRAKEFEREADLIVQMCVYVLHFGSYLQSGVSRYSTEKSLFLHYLSI